MNIGYIRVSTQEQKQSGLSMTGQEQKIQEYARLKDLPGKPNIIRDDGISAKDLNRPGIEEVIELVKKKQVSRLIIYKLDRLTRSVKDLGYLIELFDKYSVEFVSITESIDTSTAGGKLMLNMIGSIAQWEREVISERTRFALNVKKDHHERTGTIPYGYKVNGDKKTLLPIPSEQKVLNTIKNMRLKNHMTTVAIATSFNQQGIRTKRCLKWYPSTINKILKRMGIWK